MIGLGTIINTAAVIAGGLIGICFKKGMKQKMQDTLMQACGVSVIFLGISGTLIGEWLDIEQKMDLEKELI